MMRNSAVSLLVGMVASIAAQTPFTYSLVPPRAAPDSAFTLWLLSQGFICATRFTHHNVTVNPPDAGRGTLTLSFLPEEDPAVKCAESPGAVYGPDFRPIPPLKAGDYEVIAIRKRRCQVEPPYCRIPDFPEPAGILRVAKGGSGWFVKPRQVRPDRPFTLQLLNQKYGNCNFAFTDSSLKVGVSPKEIHITSVIRHCPERLCLVDLHPHGPSFPVKGLAAGSYLVHFREARACEVLNPPCEPLPLREELVDTLTVASTSVISPATVVNAPLAALRGKLLTLVLPRGLHGSMQAEISSLSGRRLQSWGFAAESGGLVRLAVSGQPERGLYFLKLNAASGETHTLRVLQE